MLLNTMLLHNYTAKSAFIFIYSALMIGYQFNFSQAKNPKKIQQTSQNSYQQVWQIQKLHQIYKTFNMVQRSPYQRSVLPLTHRSHHSSQVGLPLLLIFILGVPDQVCIHRLALTVTLQSVELSMKNKESTNKFLSHILTNKLGGSS